VTSTSKFGYYVSPYASSLQADYPMSTAAARWHVNNARHLVDQASQFRVNWVAIADNNVKPTIVNTTGLEWPAGNTDWKHVISHYFPISMIGYDNGLDISSYEPDYGNPVNLIISLAGYTQNSDELKFRVVIQPASRPFGTDGVNDQCLAYVEDSTTSNTSEWLLDKSTSTLYPESAVGDIVPRKFQITEYDSNVYDIDMFMVRATVYAKEGYSSGSGFLTGLCIREFQV
jgi:hypothetical protein